MKISEARLAEKRLREWATTTSDPGQRTRLLNAADALSRALDAVAAAKVLKRSLEEAGEGAWLDQAFCDAVDHFEED